MSVTKMNFACIYVDELEINQKFYEKYLGFQQEQEFRPGEIFGKLGEIHCWMGSGYKRAATDEKSTRATVMFGVKSVGSLYENLKSNGEKIIQEKPVQMKNGVFWLQFSDPSGNIIEVLGAQ
ncbi:MAG: VOC family protein [Bdellovibrionaceae bacterium]|nr:VOC family protein [Pseudobdellovibrionaceae bacterium]